MGVTLLEVATCKRFKRSNGYCINLKEENIAHAYEELFSTLLPLCIK